MKSSRNTVAAAVLTVSYFVSSASGEPLKPANEAEKAYVDYVAAWKAKDLPALDAVIANDYMTLNGEKKVAHKSNEMEEAKNSPSYDLMQVDEIHSVVVGDAAVVSALLTVAGTDGGKPYKVQVRDLATFIKRAGSLNKIRNSSPRNVACQPSLLLSPPPNNSSYASIAAR